MVDQNQEGDLRSKGPNPQPGSLAQGSSARKRSPHKFWLEKTADIEAVEDELLESQAVPLREPTHRCIHTHSTELQHWGSRLKGNSGIQERS